MPARHVNIDRETPMLLPVDLRDWVPKDDLAHFILEAVDLVDVSAFRSNERGTGSAQYPPRMLLAVLVYCYTQGLFGSRRIEAATHQHLSVRYLAANTHPDHDTICKFRRENFDAVAECFVRVLELAKTIGLLRVGSVAIDGTRLSANASKHRNVSYERAGELLEKLRADVADLLLQAERADLEPAQKEALPKELARREHLRQKLEAARAEIEARNHERVAREQAAYEAKLEARAERPGAQKGARPQPPKPEVPPNEMSNLSDGESRLMRKSRHEAFAQSYNAQAAVCAAGSQLILGVHLSQCPSDANEMEPTLAAIPARVGVPSDLLLDCGYRNVPAWERVGAQGIEVYAAVGTERPKRYDFRDPGVRPAGTATLQDPALLAMKAKLETPHGRAHYARRKSSVEPVFGLIKATLGFRQCLLRGVEKVRGEWQLVALAYNCRRLWKLRRSQTRPRPAHPASAARPQNLPQRPVAAVGASLGTPPRPRRRRLGYFRL